MAWRRTTGRSSVLARPPGPIPNGSAAASGTRPAAGVIGPGRAGLPRGRAVLGGLLIGAAAVVVFAAVLASTASHTGRYVVAVHSLAAGTIVGPGDTATENLSLPIATRRGAFEDPNVVIGRTLAVAVTPGELIQAAMLTPAGGTASLRPVSIAVDTTSLAGLTTGASVDVLATAQSGSGVSGGGTGGPTSPTLASPAAGVEVVLRGAALLSVTRGGSSIAPASSSETVVTLGVTTLAEAETLVAASHTETITLVQAEPSDGVGAGPGPGG